MIMFTCGFSRPHVIDPEAATQAMSGENKDLSCITLCLFKYFFDSRNALTINVQILKATAERMATPNKIMLTQIKISVDNFPI